MGHIKELPVCKIGKPSNMSSTFFPNRGDTFETRKCLKETVKAYCLEKNDFKMVLETDIPSRMVFVCQKESCPGMIDACIKYGKVNGKRTYKNQPIQIHRSKKCTCVRRVTRFPSTGTEYSSIDALRKELLAYAKEVGGETYKAGICNGKYYHYIL